MGSEPSTMLYDIQQIQRQELAEKKAKKYSKLPPWMYPAYIQAQQHAYDIFTPNEPDETYTDVSVYQGCIFMPPSKPIMSRQESTVSLLARRDEKSFVWNTYEMPEHIKTECAFDELASVQRKCKFDMACMKLADQDGAD